MQVIKLTGCLHSLYHHLWFFFVYDDVHLPPFTSFSIFLLNWTDLFFLPLGRPPGLTGSPVISDISLIRLSPHAPPGSGESPFSPPHPYVSPHMEHYLRSVHSSPTLSMISAARGLSPAEGKIQLLHVWLPLAPANPPLTLKSSNRLQKNLF